MRRALIFVSIVVLVALIVILWVASVSWKARDKNLIKGSGTIEATEVEISAKVSGRIEELHAEEGTEVKQGDLLMKLAYDELSAKGREMVAGIKAAEAQEAQAQDNLDNARVELKRARDLYAQGAYPKQQLDFQVTRVAVLEAQVRAAGKLAEQASRGLGSLDTQIANYTLYSPLDGVVLSKNAEVGETALPGMSLLTLGDLSTVWIKVYITEPDLGRVKLAQKARVTTDAFPDKPHWGRVSWVSDQAEFTPKNVQTKDERARLVYAVKILLDNPDRTLKPGMMADAEILLENRP
jgi:HlyD family secretion protein